MAETGWHMYGILCCPGTSGAERIISDCSPQGRVAIAPGRILIKYRDGGGYSKGLIANQTIIQKNEA